MAKYINADELKEWIETTKDKYYVDCFNKFNDGIHSGMYKVEQQIDKMPGVEIIRCKDCKHFSKDWRTFCLKGKDIDIDSNNYCYHAERKEVK